MAEHPPVELTPPAPDEDAPPVEEEEPPKLTRRERRAAARGGPVPKIAGPAGSRLTPPPVRPRDYAARKRG